MCVYVRACVCCILLVVFMVPVVKNLVLIPVHTTPGSAETELSALDDVVKAAKKKCRTKVSDTQ